MIFINKQEALIWLKTFKQPLLSMKKIIKYNKKIFKRDSTLVNLEAFPKHLSDKKLNKVINKMPIPKLPKYYRNKIITKKILNKYLIKRQISAIAKKNIVQKGLTIRRTNLRLLPTNQGFYDATSSFDRIQESELLLNSPVLILHQSQDHKWLFVQATSAKGWVKKSDIAFVDDENFAFFSNPKAFIIITEAVFLLNKQPLDMSVKLPLLMETDKGYLVFLPTIINNHFEKVLTFIPQSKASNGYLTYTLKNLVFQAFQYLHYPYRWGGQDYSVDCSSYIANVFRTFGFTFPRDTSCQCRTVGNPSLNVSKMSNAKKRKILSKTTGPTLLYLPSHVVLFLKIINQRTFIIHASGRAGRVEVDFLENPQNDLSYAKIRYIAKII